MVLDFIVIVFWWILINISVSKYIFWYKVHQLCVFRKNHHQICVCMWVCAGWHFRKPFFFLVTHLQQWIIISTLDFFYFFYAKGVIYVVNDTICCCRGIIFICCLACLVTENSLSLLFVGLDYDVNLCAFDWDYCRTVGSFSQNRLCYQQVSNKMRIKGEKFSISCICPFRKFHGNLFVEISVEDSQKQYHFQMMTSFMLKLLIRITFGVVCWTIKNVNILF